MRWMQFSLNALPAGNKYLSKQQNVSHSIREWHKMEASICGEDSQTSPAFNVLQSVHRWIGNATAIKIINFVSDYNISLTGAQQLSLLFGFFERHVITVVLVAVEINTHTHYMPLWQVLLLASCMNVMTIEKIGHKKAAHKMWRGKNTQISERPASSITRVTTMLLSSGDRALTGIKRMESISTRLILSSQLDGFKFQAIDYAPTKAAHRSFDTILNWKWHLRCEAIIATVASLFQIHCS